MRNTQTQHTKPRATGGYSLAELVVSVGVFSIVMLLASGAYLLMIGISRQAQGSSAGIDNLSFALERMARSIRTGTNYDCGGPGSCSNGTGTFSFTNAAGESVSYTLASSAIRETVDSIPTTLTDSSVTVTDLTFYGRGTATPPSDYEQPRITISVSGTVSYGPDKTKAFTIETGATMRGTDI